MMTTLRFSSRGSQRSEPQSLVTARILCINLPEASSRLTAWGKDYDYR
jgi:hypothetical protein